MKMTTSTVFVLVLFTFLYGVLASKRPLPTASQLTWSNWELGAIVHFNMATYQRCTGGPVPSPSLFNPSKIDTDNWAAAMKAFGAKYAVLVAKHNCGFTLWPSKVHFPESSFIYNYTVAESKSPSQDIVADFIKSCVKLGIKPGFYYSVVTNYYLNVKAGKVQHDLMPGMAVVTQDQYYQVVLTQLTELWSSYGSLGEVWFDGGYEKDLKDNLTALLYKLQPNATAFNGQGISNNSIRWIGNEAGNAPDPNWSTGESGAGDPDSDVWCPAESDTTLQGSDMWFYNRTAGIRSLNELINVYHQTVGHNSNLLLDFAPDKDGVIPDDQFERYSQFGEFIRKCYGKPLNATSGNKTTVTLMFSPPAAYVDRFVLQENQSLGQRVRSYTVTIVTRSHTRVVVNGTSIGHKKISLLARPMEHVTHLVFTAIESVGVPFISNFAAYACLSKGQI